MWNKSESKMKLHKEELSWNYFGVNSLFPNRGSPKDGLTPEEKWTMPVKLSKQFNLNKYVDETVKSVDNVSTNLYAFADDDGQTRLKGNLWFKDVAKGKNDKKLQGLEIRINVHLVDQNELTICDAVGTPKVFLDKYCWTFKFLPTLDTMWEKTDLYFTKDTIRVRFGLLFLNGGRGHSDQEFLPKGLTNFQFDMKNLLSSGDASDVVIVCGSKTFPTHKCILDVRSPAFSQMLSTPEMEQMNPCIINEDTSPETMKHILQYIYTSTVDVAKMEPAELSDLLKASSTYELLDLKKMLVAHMTKSMDNKTCGMLAVMAYSDSASLADRERIHKYFPGKWKELTKDQNFKALVRANPAAFVQPFEN